MNEALTRALAEGGGVLDAARRPLLHRLIRRAVETGRLVALLPGAYVRASDEPDELLRARALMVADPDAVVTGPSAARLFGWDAPGQSHAPLTASSWRLRSRPGFALERHAIPALLVRRMDGIRLTSPALTVLDLVSIRGASAIDEGLRRRIPLAALWRALELTPQRPGNKLLRRLLSESRDEPWSPAERLAHAALHRAGLHAWTANYPIGLDRFTDVYLDIAFRSACLAIEIDGRDAHDGWASRARDTARDRRLAAFGWQVVRFTAAEVFADPDGFAQEVQRLLTVRSRQLA